MLEDRRSREPVYSTETHDAIQTALQYIGTDYAKSQGKIRQYLLKRNFTEVSIDQSIEFLLEHKYIDELAFCKRLQRRHSGGRQKSRSALIQLLYQHGVSKQVIDEFRDSIPSDERTIAEYFKYKYKHPEKHDYYKMARHLQSRGYSEGLIRRILSEYYGNNR